MNNSLNLIWFKANKEQLWLEKDVLEAKCEDQARWTIMLTWLSDKKVPVGLDKTLRSVV